MTERMLQDKMDQIIRFGYVNARQPEKMRVKVTIPDTVGQPLITDFLPVLCPRASGDLQYDLPDIGDQVLCLFLPYGLEQGFVIGAMYGKQTPPVQSGDKWHRKFKDGTFLEYDREAHKLTASVQGDVEITATGSLMAQTQGPAQVSSQTSLSLDAPAMSMGGGGGGATNATMQGTFTLSNGDIIAEMVSLRSHTHTCPACGAETSPPIAGGGGGGGSGGGDSGESGSESGDGGNNEAGGDKGSGEGNGGNEGNGESGGNNTNVSNPGLELSPSLGAAFAATGFVWTEAGKAQFEETKKKVQLRDNEVFDTILCLPTIAEAEARDANGENRLGWLYLKQMFEKWMSGKANTDSMLNPEPLWVSMDWALTYYRVKAAWEALTSYLYLFSNAAKKELFNSITKSGLITGKREKFQFCKLDWHFWKRYYFQDIPVFGMEAFPADGLMAAMGDFRLRTLADGIIEPSPSGHRIIVERVSIFIWDSFNFEDDQVMYYWSCANKKFQITDPEQAVFLQNSDFRAFRETTGMGDDFLVLSDPKDVDNFDGYEYEI